MASTYYVAGPTSYVAGGRVILADCEPRAVGFLRRIFGR